MDGFRSTPELIKSYQRRNTARPRRKKQLAFAVPRPTVWGWLAIGLVLAAVLAASAAYRRSEGSSSFPSSGTLARINRLESEHRTNARTLIRVWSDHNERIRKLEDYLYRGRLPEATRGN